MNRQRCTYCGSASHTRPHCPKTADGQGNRKNMRCTYCGGRNHYRDACFKLRALHNRPAGRYVRD